MRRGGRNAFVYVFFGLLFFTSACNTDAKEENLTREEAIIAKTIEKGESVDSFMIEMGMYEDYIWEDGSTEYDYVFLSGTDFLERSHSRSTQKYGNEETETIGFLAEIYRDTEEVYLNMNNEGWRKANPSDYQYEMTEYEGAIDFLGNIQNMREVMIKENESEYEISYSGEDESLYEGYALPSPLIKEATSFVVTGSPEVFFRIEKEDYTIREFTTKFFYEDEAESGAEAILTVETYFDEINEVEDVVIPNEVIEEAKVNE
ncbi:hypothetical protein CHH61_10855 [Shouchella clausii]|uniref:Uncharacterized protein n=2 Tax=Shouchella clausii TaxID=79880 RepID=A0A268S0K1_SHOCL|nr:hypothetical protein CHH61_10855 [Shouchella clausii]